MFCYAEVSNEDQVTKELSLIIVGGSRDWLRLIKLDWRKVHCMPGECLLGEFFE